MKKFLSICTGMEAASEAWNPLGWEAGAFSEIEPACCDLLKCRHPDVPNLGDMTAPDFIDRAKKHGPYDVVCGGVPCQSFSVAGKRGGLDDPRGNLMIRFLEICEAIRAPWILLENVPGLLSSSEGEDFKAVLGTIEDMGYIVDVDILDAQYFGVPQRRRRVFVCARSREDLLNAKTITSALTIAQCVTEILLLCFIVLKSRSVKDSPFLTFDVGEPKLSLQKRIKLFSLEKEGAAQILAENLIALHRWSGQGREDLGSPTGKSGLVDTKHSEDTKYLGLNEEQVTYQEGLESIELSWKNDLDEVLKIANECITSTYKRETIESKTYTCARLLLRIASSITPSMNSSPPFWSAVSSISTTLTELIDYARSTSSDLFTEVEWIHNWNDFYRQAVQANKSFAGFRTRQFGQEVLLISESVRRHTAPRREKGKGITHDVAPSIGASGRGYERAGETRGQDPVVACPLTGTP